MEKTISCGSIVVKDRKMLLALPYNNGKWNLPKGMMDAEESFQTTAHRETWEECNVDTSKSIISEDLGRFEYLRDKDLYLFLSVIDYEPELKCNSTFYDEQTELIAHEMVAFKWVDFNDYSLYVSKALKFVLDEAIPRVMDILSKA